MIKKILVLAITSIFITTAWSKAIVDPDVQAIIKKPILKNAPATATVPVIIFLRSLEDQDQFITDLAKIPQIRIQKMQSLPALFVSIPQNEQILEKIINNPAAAQISSFHAGREELENSEQAILLRPSSLYPSISNWWDKGHTGHQGVLGLIDSGVAPDHPSLQGKNIVIRKEPGSGFTELKNGVRSPHGTGVACIYAGQGNSTFPNDNGIAYHTPTIIAGLAGEGDGNFDDIGQTLSTLDWMLNRSEMMPTVINYSFGNGPVTCNTCTDWSGLAHVVDYVVNRYKILWVKSAGNSGYIASQANAPFASTMSAPADNYNGLTVANMNPAVSENGKWKLSPEREKHYIRYTSSRGPTLSGRKKPDISAPGNDTRTCAPDPATYSFKYTAAMDYRDGYRLMGGTSSAAPHVGASLLLLQDAGIVEPIAQKALLINSADAWADNDIPGPDDSKQPIRGDHFPVQGSEWNRTYGWGYLNMQQAYEQRTNLVINKLTAEHPQQSYEVDLPIGAKITLVHERRVGYGDDYVPWKLSPLSLEIVDATTHQIIDLDDSAQDTVHQVANCKRDKNERHCSEKTTLIHAIVNVKLLNKTIDGASEEPFALVMSVPFKNL